MTVSLTKRQRDVLESVKAYIVEHQRPPTVRELGRRLGVCDRTAHQHLMTLELKGAIAREAGQARTVQVVGDRLVWDTGATDRTGRTELEFWKAAALQATQDLRDIEAAFAKAEDLSECPLGPGTRFADWTSPANTMRWIEAGFVPVEKQDTRYG